MFLFATHNNETEIKAIGFRSIKIPAEEPWGASIYVLEHKLETCDGIQTLKIEMQSGDVIELSAETLEFSEKPL